jgi:hypothetical protein
LKLTFSQIRVSAGTTSGIWHLQEQLERLASVTSVNEYSSLICKTHKIFHCNCEVFSHDNSRSVLVFVHSQRRLDPFLQWILEYVRYNANDDAIIELDLTVLGHII